MGKNIEDDLSSIHQLEEGEYLVTDPKLLANMALSRSIKSGSVNLVTSGTRITPDLIQRLQEKGIETIQAEPRVENLVADASNQLGEVFVRTREQFISEGIRTTRDAIKALKEVGRIQDAGIQEGMFGFVKDIVHNLSDFAAEGIRSLKNHDQNTTLHSVEVSLMSMQLAQELGWSRERMIQAGLGGMVHDVGKAGISQDLLSCPDVYTDEQWEEMQTHALIGYLILSNSEKIVDISAFCAGTHHERFNKRGRARGYGILSNFADQVERVMDLDYDRDDKATSEVVAISDVHSALGEARSYKTRKLPVEIAIIMNLEAKHGKFNPAFYRAWYEMYKRKYPMLLQKGHCFPLPSTKRRELAKRTNRDGGRIVLPVTELRLTFEELTKVGLIPKLMASGYKVSSLKRRDGITLHELRKRRVAGIPDDFQQYGIQIEKEVHYSLVVVEVMERAQGRFILLKDGDTIPDLRQAIRNGSLDPIQQKLLGHTNIELDFSKEVHCPV
ncbi:MAG: HD domain-containing protein [Magnetococcales bacterium]|nr:HD domain-containing protein [Magnetococcales bacterium]